MRNFFKRILAVPSGSVSLEGVQLWEVRWISRHGAYSSDTRPEMEAFPSKEDAETFAASLREAFKLLKHTAGTKVTVTCREEEKEIVPVLDAHEKENPDDRSKVD